MQLTGCIHVGAAGAVLSGACQAQDAIAIAVHQNRVGMSDLEALVELQRTSTRSLQLLHALYLSDQLSKMPAFEFDSDSVSVGMPHKGKGKADGFACGEDREPLSHGGKVVFSCTVEVDFSGGPATHAITDVGEACCVNDEPPAPHAAVIEVLQDGSITYSIDESSLSNLLSCDIGW